jgi:hypothetical protein
VILDTRNGNFSNASKKISLFKIKEDEGYNEYDEPEDDNKPNEYSGREKYQSTSIGLAQNQSNGRSKITNYKQPRGRDLLLGFNTQYGTGFGNYKNSSKL